MACNSFPFHSGGSNCGGGCGNGCGGGCGGGCGINMSPCTWTLIIIAVVFIWIFCCNDGEIC